MESAGEGQYPFRPYSRGRWDLTRPQPLSARVEFKVTAHSQGHRAGAGAGAELWEDVVNVLLGGVGGDEQRFGNLAIGEALGEQRQHFPLAGGEALDEGGRGVTRRRGRGGCARTPGRLEQANEIAPVKALFLDKGK